MTKPMKNRFRHGLKEWHWQHTQNLLTQLLWQTVVGRRGGRRELIDEISRKYAVRQSELLAIFGLLTVTRTETGASFCRMSAGLATEVAINWGQLEHFSAGGEIEEYAAFADDPVIGSRWVQNIDEALLMALGHELAHFVAALTEPQSNDAPHGERFRAIYRMIREYGVNPMLDANAASEAQQAAARHEARLLRKIQALRKMASDTTSNVHEAERALQQLQALLAKYGLNDTGSGLNSTPHLIERSVPLLKRGRYKPLTHYCHAISQFCGVEAVIHTRHWKRGREGRQQATEFLSWFGAPSDVEMAVYLSELLPQSLVREEDAYRDSSEYRQALRGGKHAASLLASFRDAFAERVNQRLYSAREAVENSWVDAQSENGALMVARDAALQEAFRQRYPRLGTHRRSASSAQADSAAMAAGKQAAERVNLSRPVTEGDIKRLR